MKNVLFKENCQLFVLTAVLAVSLSGMCYYSNGLIPRGYLLNVNGKGYTEEDSLKLSFFGIGNIIYLAM